MWVCVGVYVDVCVDGCICVCLDDYGFYTSQLWVPISCLSKFGHPVCSISWDIKYIVYILFSNSGPKWT